MVGEVARNGGKAQESQKYYEHALKIDPQQAIIVKCLAEAHFEAGQSSIKHFRRAMAMNTSSDLFDNSRFFMKLGQAYLEKDKREKAFHCFNDA